MCVGARIKGQDSFFWLSQIEHSLVHNNYDVLELM